MKELTVEAAPALREGERAKRELQPEPKETAPTFIWENVRGWKLQYFLYKFKDKWDIPHKRDGKSKRQQKTPFNIFCFFTYILIYFSVLHFNLNTGKIS